MEAFPEEIDLVKGEVYKPGAWRESIHANASLSLVQTNSLKE
jgi:hypothetical protein